MSSHLTILGVPLIFLLHAFRHSYHVVVGINLCVVIGAFFCTTTSLFCGKSCDDNGSTCSSGEGKASLIDLNFACVFWVPKETSPMEPIGNRTVESRLPRLGVSNRVIGAMSSG